MRCDQIPCFLEQGIYPPEQGSQTLEQANWQPYLATGLAHCLEGLNDKIVPHFLGFQHNLWEI